MTLYLLISTLLLETTVHVYGNMHQEIIVQLGAWLQNGASYWDLFVSGYAGYASFLWQEITLSYTYKPLWQNYFYWLILLSLFFFGLEWWRPWRKKQATFRKDFWLDVFYMFFNFFLFSLIIYNAASNVVVNAFADGLKMVGINNLVAIEVQSWPIWAHLLLGFLVRDFVQWWIHRLLHHSPTLWQFHKVHHSVQEMGFAAHLRYHWMENVVYRSLEYIPLALIGIGLNDFFIIHIFTLAVGHYNHSNISIKPRITAAVLGALIGLYAALTIGLFWYTTILLVITTASLFALIIGPFMPYLFNSPEMHIWHHSYHLPESHPKGMNFGLTLAIWDYIFKTAYVPHNGRDIKLGFEEVENYPEDFITQNISGFKS